MTDTAQRAPEAIDDAVHADAVRADAVRADAVERARDKVRALTSRLPSPVRVVVVGVVGFALVVAGLAMLVLPGPGLLTLFLGLAILAAEFTLAYRVLRSSHSAAIGVWDRVRRRPRRAGDGG